MGQFKKPEVRAAILETANKLFSRKGYVGTSLAEIARGAGVSTPNLYVYFSSKLEIVYAIYEPWMIEQLAEIEKQVAARTEPREKLKYLLTALWRDLPAAKNGFVNNIMQAISSATPRDRYKPTTLRRTIADLERILRDALPHRRQKLLVGTKLGLLIVMAFDGFSLYHHVDPKDPLDDRTLDVVCSMFLGDAASGKSK
jgi:AcrR family transcriptional regulator